MLQRRAGAEADGTAWPLTRAGSPAGRQPLTAELLNGQILVLGINYDNTCEGLGKYRLAFISI